MKVGSRERFLFFALMTILRRYLKLQVSDTARQQNGSEEKYIFATYCDSNDYL